MLKLYSIPESLYCAKLRVVMRHKGLTWQEVAPPGGYGSAEYREIVVTGSLPALVDGPLLLADSEAIAEYLNEKHPAPAMLPETVEARAKARELSRFHDTRLEPELRALFAHMSPAARDEAVVGSRGAAFHQRLGQLAKLLAAFGRDDGNGLLLCDCGFPITLAWMQAMFGPLGLDTALPEPISHYLSWVHSMPAVNAEMQEYMPAVEQWVRSRAG